MKPIFIFNFVALFFFFLCSPHYSGAQTPPLGIMPVRIHISDGVNPLFAAGWYMQIQAGGEGIGQYEEKYFPFVMKGLAEGYVKNMVMIRELSLDDLSKEDRLAEESFYKKMLQDFPLYQMENKKTLIQGKNIPKQSGSAGPVANQFADRLDCDLLVYISIVGYHQGNKIKEDANGNLGVYGMIIDGNTGKIVGDVSVRLSNKDYTIPSGKNFSEKAAYKLGQRFSKQLASEVKKVMAAGK